MSNVIKLLHRADVLDAKEFQDVVGGPAYARIVAKIEAILASEQRKIESSESMEELRRAQGAISALRSVLDLPNRILAEMQKEARTS